VPGVPTDAAVFQRMKLARSLSTLLAMVAILGFSTRLLNMSIDSSRSEVMNCVSTWNWLVSETARLFLHEVFHVQRRTGGADEARRHAHVDRVTDLRAVDGELVVVLAVDLVGQHKFVFQDHQRFVGDVRDGEKRVAHFLFQFQTKRAP
jgi:hypothetical protein